MLYNLVENIQETYSQTICLIATREELESGLGIDIENYRDRH